MLMQHTEDILSEYRQSPGLRLTTRQAARLWALEPMLCETLLNALVNDGQLYVDERGQYALAGRLAHRRRAGASPLDTVA